MRLSSNEWDPLKSVIVGRADKAKIPKEDKSLRAVNYADKPLDYFIKSGPYPKQVIEEANEDLEKLVDFLTGLGVEVYRPDAAADPLYYNYCPRDTVLVSDNKILATPMPIQARFGEWMASMKTFIKFTDGVVTGRMSKDDNLYNLDCIGNPNILALNETEPAFDAANVLRDNDNLYYLVSNTGNKKGADFLQSIFPDKKVWTIEGVYSYIHIDSTIALLREGLMLLNPARIKSKDQLPKPLQSWDAIWCPEPVDIGHYPDYCNASPWINVNLFSVNPNLVILEENQHPTRKALEAHGIECAMLPMRHARTLGGCFHCVTLDLVRE